MNSQKKFLIFQLVQILFGICFATESMLNNINSVDESQNDQTDEKLPWFLDDKLQLFRSHENLVKGYLFYSRIFFIKIFNFNFNLISRSFICL